ncbi:MAG: serine hydrolase [Aminobacterium sp.]|jgi:beta-lactamase class A|uniref:serine hydrolase n=1 Tax=Aminobacterium sp. MB27-C1 TaxID=3070661 RepID=UPI001BCD1837|nr:serine hydrolase [Aminobacterium sp. MB27-C1]MDD2206608.1 class A beta-lactamase-related serine hydrolase [Aminobacterium sp.]MDD3425479.1 class A beta-lactamase-related serine hydrolase [Aminobacterium sp.]MDD3706828.1 class A beta-lactamase-related serine hydrolase [Aminobacterium sp.]MDD4228645.1 class A beta-lactamase-related serine hydrolase [Aminobacterium sp.]MDD4551573.1 class A beta-lactamase-related serine hydrolase [Aminobacterium sp.]
MSWKKQIEQVLISKGMTNKAGIIIKDIKNDETFSLNGEQSFPSASLIKLSILWTLFSKENAEELSLNETITLKEADKVEGGLLHLYKEGAKLRLEDLALLMIAVSDNTATNLIIDRLGIDQINNEIKKLGLKGTILGRKMLDFEAKKAGKDNYTTPEDISNLLGKILTSTSLPVSRRKRMLEMLSAQKLNIKLPSLVPFNDVDEIEGFLAHKTGELPGSEHDAGIFFYNSDHPILVTVLTRNLSNRVAGVDLCAQIGAIIFEHFGKGYFDA